MFFCSPQNFIPAADLYDLFYVSSPHIIRISVLEQKSKLILFFKFTSWNYLILTTFCKIITYK